VRRQKKGKHTVHIRDHVAFTEHHSKDCVTSEAEEEDGDQDDKRRRVTSVGRIEYAIFRQV
jgi:hypothetical protein